MKDLCFDQFGITKEKSNPKKRWKGTEIFWMNYLKKRRIEDGGYLSDDEDEVLFILSVWNMLAWEVSANAYSWNFHEDILEKHEIQLVLL